MLNNCVLVWKYSSPESGFGRIHVGGDRVRHVLSVSAVLGPAGDRVTQVSADYPLKVLAVLGAVEVSEDIVERAVLEEHQHDVVEGVGRVELRHQLRSLTSQTSRGMSTGLYHQECDRGRFSRAPKRAPKLFDGGHHGGSASSLRLNFWGCPFHCATQKMLCLGCGLHPSHRWQESQSHL